MSERVPPPPWGDIPERHRQPRAPQQLVATPDIVLRRRSDDNFDDYYRAIVENEVFLARFLSWAKDYTPARAALDQQNAMQKVASGTLAPYCVYHKGDFAGMVSLWGIKNKSAHIGYWLTKDATKQGIMTAAAAELLHMGFTHLGLQEVTVEVLPTNLASVRLAQKLGGTPRDMTEDHELQFVITPSSLQEAGVADAGAPPVQ